MQQPVTTWTQLEAYINEVTAQQIAKCKRISDPVNQGVCFAVENERGEGYEGEMFTYTVRYNSEDGFSCTCGAGAAKFARIAHPSGVCKHCRWTVAAALAERAAIQPEQAAPTAEPEAAAPKAQPLKPTPLAPQPDQEEARKQSEIDH